MKSAKKKKPTAAKKPAASKKATTKTTAPAAEATVQMTEELTAQKPAEIAGKETVSPAAKTKPATKSSKPAAAEKPKATKAKKEPKKEKQVTEEPKAEPVEAKQITEEPKAEPAEAKQITEEPKAEPAEAKQITEEPKAEPVETKEMPETPEEVFERRLARHYDELKWLYCELYHGDMQAFDYFVSVLRRSYDERKPELRAQDARREADPDWYRRRDLLGMMLYTNAFAGNLRGVEEKLPYLHNSYTVLMPARFRQL